MKAAEYSKHTKAATALVSTIQSVRAAGLNSVVGYKTGHKYRLLITLNNCLIAMAQ
jgi:hypothetical protein